MKYFIVDHGWLDGGVGVSFLCRCELYSTGRLYYRFIIINSFSFSEQFELSS